MCEGGGGGGGGGIKGIGSIPTVLLAYRVEFSGLALSQIFETKL